MAPEIPSSGDAAAPARPLAAILEVNEARVLGTVRQLLLTEKAETLNARLQEETAARQRTEEALRASEERYRALFTASPAGLFVCDENAVILQYNARAVELWGREPVCGVERYCGSTALWLPNGERLPLEQSPIVEVLRTGMPALALEVAVQRPDGSRVPALVSFAALRNAEGKITGAIASCVDLTERKQLEQQSLRAQRMESIGTLAGGIAHDLNNSLGPIMMALDLLRMRFPDAASEKLIDLIHTRARRGANMVQQLVSFARGVEGERVEVQVPLLVGAIEKMVAETFSQPIRIKTQIPPGISSVRGDAALLHQVLLNLCLNARDAMPEGGLLTLSAENRSINATDAGLLQNASATPGPYVMLEVRDDGAGMPPELVEHIFEPFFTTKEFGHGSGLGLATSLGIVKSHGGFVHVRSAVGQGTMFQIFLPAWWENPLPPTAPPPDLENPEGHGELILVIDDEEPMRVMSRQILETFGYRTVLAADGLEAIALYAERGPEIAAVISDMTMPMMDGPETIRILRSMNLRLPIIGCSGLATSTSAGTLAELGVTHILAKPFTTGTLLQMVRTVLLAAAAAPSS